eukprot:Hpha_TRINITY_DN15554_c0_g1::TRINITY_DN15554_c0_g1_i5::g.105424::m.105424
MPALTCKIISGRGFCDISPTPMCCCGKPIPSMPLVFFTLSTSDVTWQTAPAPLAGGTVTWNKVFTTVQCREPESDRLHIVVVDGAHWKPKSRGKQDMALVPPKHFYGEVRMSVIQFERAKKEVQELTLKARDGSDTGFMIKVEGVFQDDNIDDHRLGIHQVPVGPPQNGFQANTVSPSANIAANPTPHPYPVPPEAQTNQIVVGTCHPLPGANPTPHPYPVPPEVNPYTNPIGANPTPHPYPDPTGANPTPHPYPVPPQATVGANPTPHPYPDPTGANPTPHPYPVPPQATVGANPTPHPYPDPTGANPTPHPYPVPPQAT